MHLSRIFRVARRELRCTPNHLWNVFLVCAPQRRCGPYNASDTMGKPACAKCTRIWCVLPVSGVTRTRAAMAVADVAASAAGAGETSAPPAATLSSMISNRVVLFLDTISHVVFASFPSLSKLTVLASRTMPWSPMGASTTKLSPHSGGATPYRHRQIRLSSPSFPGTVSPRPKPNYAFSRTPPRPTCPCPICARCTASRPRRPNGVTRRDNNEFPSNL